ncbi:hypothetical protein CATRI_01635 [Corynebacterium atrinae]|uniref:hypothetical protein n=1 Tax=Corynebacterium atrinae TaxID=1336740 RepID=UPI0025B3B867|nr:hypothetical protein [Corynebacterium atrinae]WJY62436.1 hypothetical protein CATRI_01635 [Corynebacterium atrinae]
MSDTEKTEKTEKTMPPESVRLMVWLFAFAVGGEVLHQILNVTISFIDPSALIAAAKEQTDPQRLESIGDTGVRLAAYGSVLFMGALSLAIMGLLTWMIFALWRRSRFAGTARRMLLVFGFYFGFRVMMLFMVTPGGTNVPVALYVVDGIVQILVGVAAVMGVFLTFKEDTLKWTRELPVAKDRS